MKLQICKYLGPRGRQMGWVFGWGLVFFHMSLKLLWAGAGTTGMEFSQLIPGARSAGLAGTYIAGGNDAECLFSNPAGMVGLINPQLGLSHLAWWEGATYDAFWGVQPVGSAQYLGMNLAYFNLPPFNSTENNSQPEEQAMGMMGTAAYAIKLQRYLAIGGDVKYIFSRLSTLQASAAALDLGIQYFALNDQMTVAGVIRNLGFASAFIGAADAMPMEAGAGIAYQLWPDEIFRLSMALDAKWSLHGKIAVSAGMEGWFDQWVAFRCGMKTDSDIGDWMSMGLGLRWQKLHLDYAVMPVGRLGITHHVSLGYDFGSQKRLARPKLEVVLLTKQSVDSEGKVVQTIHLIPKVSVPAGLEFWEVSIYNSQHVEIRRYSGAKRLPLEVEWDGLDKSGKPTNAEGYYSYRFQITDRQSYKVQCSGEILPISITKLPKLKVLPRDIYAGNVAFTPKYVENLKDWEINVISADGRIVKKYSGMGTIPKDLSWDGKDTKNQPVVVREGFYFIMRVKDQAGNESTSRAPMIIADSGIKAKTSENIALDEEVRFRFQSPKDIKLKEWSLDIMEPSTGRVVRTYSGVGQVPEEVAWNSRDEQGQLVTSQKEYGYVLRLQDPMGNVWQQAQPIRAASVKIIPSNNRMMMLKVEGILFDFNQAELKPEMFEKIVEVAKLVKAYQGKEIKVFIEGHTDETGTDQYNLELSNKRAQMVMRFLVEEHGVSSSLIVMQGFGKMKPVSAEQNQNRRVEILMQISH